MPGARLDQQLQVQPLLGAAPGSFRSFAESHPLNILYITTKITQKTTNFNGMSIVSQSILPSLSTCNIRLYLYTWALNLRQQEIKWRKTAIHIRENSRGRPGA